MVQKYRKLPVVIEAMRFEDGHPSRVMDFCRNAVYHAATNRISIPTLEGVMHADVGDWIIRGIKGEYYPCKPDIFEKTYEAVELRSGGGLIGFVRSSLARAELRNATRT